MVGILTPWLRPEVVAMRNSSRPVAVSSSPEIHSAL
jgi:hypothetical protein